ncbi:MAG TPA: cytochrome bc complex cytochrome b subunit, partial [Burkholderiaceae bacterium]|nr:cytochrome bc complex cytochrome b subunit [Burkholderiaceae bacterium]
NNFIPADPLKTPPHIAPVWYFTPYYSILRATTSEFVLVLGVLAVLFMLLVWITGRSAIGKLITTVVVIGMVIGFMIFDAKFWGVVAMGASVMIFFALPWIDNSPVKSIRYRPGWHWWLYGLFVVAFVVLGYFGVQAPSAVGERISQVFTIVYFGFFLLMPWWSKMGKFKPVPDRVTFHAH